LKYKNDDLIVSLDIGSKKIVVVISEIDESNNINILGVGQAESKGGIRSGVVVNIESIVNAVNQAIEDAEIQAGREVNGVFVGISGTNIESINSKGVVAISGPDKEIKENDIARVIEAARAVAIPMDREMLHIIPQGFIVDHQRNVKYPIGMVGTRLECQIHILTIPITTIQNIVKCLNRTGIEIYDIVLQNLACARAVLEDDEKEIGVLMIDIGAETSKVCVYYQGAPYYNYIYPLGGYLITNDIAAGLKVPLATAENLKLSYGVSHFEYVKKDEKFQVPAVGGRKPFMTARENMVHIIRPRVEEMFHLIREDLIEQGVIDKIDGGIVITGGTALLPGISEVCQDVFNLQARVGIPKKLYGLSDDINTCMYAVSNGLIRWGYDKLKQDIPVMSKNVKDDREKGFLNILKKFFDELF